VLREDGTFWLNIGDSYASSKAKTVKAKDLVGIPWRVALALQEDGWWLRNAVVWHKPNPMPSSVTDRLTNSYEMVFLLTKSKKYYYDAVAVREPHVEFERSQSEKHGHVLASHTMRTSSSGRNKRDVWRIAAKPCSWDFCGGCQSLFEGKDRRKIIKKGGFKTCPECDSTDKWVDHFAMFPPDLIKPCILAGTSEVGCCPECGSPWRRVIERKQEGESWINPKAVTTIEEGPISGGVGANRLGPGIRDETITLGWEPTCQCGSNANEPLEGPVSSVVLDPFAGAGTTGIVAMNLGRQFVGIDINEEYVALAKARVAKASREIA